MANPLHPHRLPQFKSTCDACHDAKVKCTQGRPACARCESRHIKCHYSISLRSYKQIRPPRDGVSGIPSTTATTVTSSSQSSPESCHTTSSASSSVSSMVEQSSFPYDPYISALGDASFPSSSAIESWTADFIGDGIPSSYAFPTDDLSESVIGRTGLEPMAYPYDDFQSTSHVRNDYATSQKPRSFSLNNICGCQQNVLHKLSEISEVNRMDVSVAFDRSLAENKNIISLCTSMVECTNSRHDQDIALMLTGLALITHVITVYDRRFRTRPRSTDDEDKVSPFGSHEYPKDHLPNGLQVQLPENPRHQQQQPPDPTSNVRLSLGSYELDRNDEAILQKSLLRIELSKVGALIASFEKRFCTMDYYNVEGSQDTEPKPLGEVIAHLKKRLMANHEVLANLKHEI